MKSKPRARRRPAAAKPHEKARPTERLNQKRRTRAALVGAALALLRAGKSPTVSEVAEAALVSPATAYRYFPSAQSLWSAVLEELGEPKPEEVFSDVQGASLQARVRALLERIGFRMFDDEALWRIASGRAHEPGKPPPSERADRIPVRTGQRMRWIDDALQPYASKLGEPTHAALRNALALVMGVEAVITLRDVCRLDAEQAKRVTLWASDALVQAALTSSARTGRR